MKLFSYKFPAAGLEGADVQDILPTLAHAVEVCSVIAEVAEFYSEALEAEFTDLQKQAASMIEAPLRRYFEYEHKRAIRKTGQPIAETYPRLDSNPILKDLAEPLAEVPGTKEAGNI